MTCARLISVIVNMRSLIPLILAFMLSACASSPIGYRTDVKVTRVTSATEPHQYLVEFRITQIGGDENSAVLSAPSVLVNAGQEGQVVVMDQEEKTGIVCTVLVKEVDGDVEAATSVTITKDPDMNRQDELGDGAMLVPPIPRWSSRAAADGRATSPASSARTR